MSALKQFRYKKIFMYASLQFCGNIEEYFSKHTEKLVVFIVMPRLKNKYNVLRLYKKGKLLEEKKIWSSENIFLYYTSWYLYHNYFLLKYINRDKNAFVIAGHPICFFGLSLQKFFTQASFVYWVGDYFPGNGLVIRLFERIKRFYHDRVDYACYLGDGINKKMNRKVINTLHKKTVMWGVKPLFSSRKLNKKLTTIENSFSLLFVGLVKESQGLEFLFMFLQKHKKYSLKIIGICDNVLYEKYKKTLRKLQIEERVYFPNKFFNDDELNNVADNSHIGVAFYNADKENPTYYTDPGKVKAYTQLGLPVLMSNVSAVAPFVKKFKAGEVVYRKEEDVEQALLKIKKNYKSYLQGLEHFNGYFYFESYYKDKFFFLEQQ